MICHICSNSTTLMGRALVLGKHDVQYFRCNNCGFIQTEKPYWLVESYSNAITRTDLGLVNRNIVLSGITKSVILTLYNSDAKFVDYGGGYGLFVRLMRDNGFNFYLFDKYCQNLLAQGFDVDENFTKDGRNCCELLTAFEVFEHLVHPLEEIEQMLHFARSILFSTLIVPSPTPKLEDWWYFGLEHGQHVALYSRKSLSILAQKHKLYLYSNGSSLHLLTEKRIPTFIFRLVARSGTSRALDLLLGRKLRRKSLLSDDYMKLTGRNPI